MHRRMHACIALLLLYYLLLCGPRINARESLQIDKGRDAERTYRWPGLLC